MTERTVTICDVCGWEHDGNQLDDPVALTDKGPLGSIIDPHEMTGPAEHLCADCWVSLLRAIVDWTKTRKQHHD